MGSEAQRRLVDMAYAEIASDACPDLILNQKAMTEAFDRLAEAGKGSPEERQVYERGGIAYFGVYTGLILAESFLDKPSFCDGAERVKQKGGAPRAYWIEK